MFPERTLHSTRVCIYMNATGISLRYCKGFSFTISRDFPFCLLDTKFDDHPGGGTASTNFDINRQNGPHTQTKVSLDPNSNPVTSHKSCEPVSSNTLPPGSHPMNATHKSSMSRQDKLSAISAHASPRMIPQQTQNLAPQPASMSRATTTTTSMSTLTPVARAPAWKTVPVRNQNQSDQATRSSQSKFTTVGRYRILGGRSRAGNLARAKARLEFKPTPPLIPKSFGGQRRREDSERKRELERVFSLATLAPVPPPRSNSDNFAPHVAHGDPLPSHGEPLSSRGTPLSSRGEPLSAHGEPLSSRFGSEKTGARTTCDSNKKSNRFGLPGSVASSRFGGASKSKSSRNRFGGRAPSAKGDNLSSHSSAGDSNEQKDSNVQTTSILNESTLQVDPSQLEGCTCSYASYQPGASRHTASCELSSQRSGTKKKRKNRKKRKKKKVANDQSKPASSPLPRLSNPARFVSSLSTKQVGLSQQSLKSSEEVEEQERAEEVARIEALFADSKPQSKAVPPKALRKCVGSLFIRMRISFPCLSCVSSLQKKDVFDLIPQLIAYSYVLPKPEEIDGNMRVENVARTEARVSYLSTSKPPKPC